MASCGNSVANRIHCLCAMILPALVADGELPLSLSLSNRVCPPSVRSCTAADPSLYFWLRHQGWPGQAINHWPYVIGNLGCGHFSPGCHGYHQMTLTFLFEMAQVNCGNTLQQRNNIA